MDRQIELRRVPSKIIIEAYLSGSMGGPDSYGGLDGQGQMVVVDLEKREMVTVSGFQERLEAWRQTNVSNPCHLKRKPTLRVLNLLVSHMFGVYYDSVKQIIVSEVA